MPDAPLRLPDAAAVETVLAGLDPATADADLAPALSAAFPGFSFSVASIDDFYWRSTGRSVISADGARLGDHREWVERELALVGGDLDAFWQRHRSGEHRVSEWQGNPVAAFASTGPGVADFVQILLGREVEVVAGGVVDPGLRPWHVHEVLDPSWGDRPGAQVQKLAGPVYRLRARGGSVVHMRGFLSRSAHIEHRRREARRPEMEARVILEVGPDGSRNIPFLDLVPGWFNYVPRENRFFADWARSSASAARIFDHWAFDIQNYELHGAPQPGFIPRPLKVPAERLLMDEGISVHRLMERIEAVDAAIGLPFSWFFLMTHGNWVDPDVGRAIAEGLRAERVRLPAGDAAVVLDWAATEYLF